MTERENRRERERTWYDLVMQIGSRGSRALGIFAPVSTPLEVVYRSGVFITPKDPTDPAFRSALNGTFPPNAPGEDMGSVLRKVPCNKLTIPLVKFRNPLGNSEGLRFDRFIQNKRYDKKLKVIHWFVTCELKEKKKMCHGSRGRSRESLKRKKKMTWFPRFDTPKLYHFFDMICAIYTGTTYYEYGKIAYQE